MALSVYMAISNIGDERINGTNQMYCMWSHDFGQGKEMSEMWMPD